jgi:hypothetical protein
MVTTSAKDKCVGMIQWGIVVGLGRQLSTMGGIGRGHNSSETQAAESQDCSCKHARTLLVDAGDATMETTGSVISTSMSAEDWEPVPSLSTCYTRPTPQQRAGVSGGQETQRGEPP